MAESVQRRLGFGIFIAYGGSGTAAAAYTNVAGLYNVEPPEKSFDKVEVDGHDNPVDTNSGAPVKDFIAGWMNQGEAKLQMFLSGATYQILDVASGLQGWWKIVLPGSQGGWPFRGILDKLKATSPIKEAMTAEGTITLITGTAGTIGTYNLSQT